MSQSHVWVLVTYSRWGEDEINVFARQAEAEAEALAYGREYWPDELGTPPATYDDAVGAWEEHGLWESDDSKWELVKAPIR